VYQSERRATTPHLRWPRTYAQARITHGGSKGAVAVHSPFHGCDVFITPRENLLLMWLGRGKRTTYRSIPSVLGYTMSGFRKAIATLRKLGLLGFRSRRGCHGFTHLWSNVSSSFSEGRSFVNRLLLPAGKGGTHSIVEGGPAAGRAVVTASPPRPRLGRLVYDGLRWVVGTGSPDTIEA
jgi:hypothetical protein